MTSRPPATSLRLWPPTSSTRASVIDRVSAHLSSTTFFSQRYGRISDSEAALLADQLEQQAFSAASLYDAPSDISAVQFYAKEASRLMLECLKKGPSPTPLESDVVPMHPHQHTHEVSVSPSLSTHQSVSGSPLGTAGLSTPSLSSSSSSSHGVVFDISGSARELLSEEAAVDLLKPLSLPNAFSNICLSNKSFGEGAAKVAADALQALKAQLVHLNLSDIVASRPEEEALAVMSIFSRALQGCKLKSLDLSDNALGEKGVRAFSELLKTQFSLEELYFKNNGISEEAAVAICELLPFPAKLRVLHFHNNMTGDAGAITLSELVQKASSLESIRFSSARVATEGGIALAQSLLSGSRLQMIDIRDNPFGQEVALALNKPLKQHKDLKELYLSYLGFEDEGVEAVLHALQESAPYLQVLDLAGNEITIKSAMKLAEFIVSKTHLTRINLSENELEDEGVSCVCTALHDTNEALLELDLSETCIGKAGAIAAARAVSRKPNFRLLNINGNYIPQVGIQLVQGILKNSSNGLSVLGSLDDNDEDGANGSKEDDDSDLDTNLQAQLNNVRL